MGVTLWLLVACVVGNVALPTANSKSPALDSSSSSKAVTPPPTPLAPVAAASLTSDDAAEKMELPPVTQNTVEAAQAVDLPTVSLCIPCIPRDVGPHLDALLRSASQQTLQPREVIIALSETTDEDADALRSHVSFEFPSLPVLVLSTPDQQNAGLNRNRASAVATSDLVAFMDADDEMHPQKLEVVAGVAAQTSAKCVLHSYVMEGGEISQANQTTYDWHSAHVVLGKEISEQTGASIGVSVNDPQETLGFSVPNIQIHHGHPTCRREVVQGVRQEDLPRGQDVRFLRRVYEYYGVEDDTMVVCDLPLTFYNPSEIANSEIAETCHGASSSSA